ncbi:MAG: hypothetical protein QXG25_00725 [Nitrososphaerota archaeon]
MGELSKMKYDLGVMEYGLNSIMENFKSVFPTTRSYLMVLEFKSIGFRDLIDLLLYTTVPGNNLKSLTRDKRAGQVLGKSRERASAVILKDEFSENSEWMKSLTAEGCRMPINCFQL